MVHVVLADNTFKLFDTYDIFSTNFKVHLVHIWCKINSQYFLFTTYFKRCKTAAIHSIDMIYYMLFCRQIWNS